MFCLKFIYCLNKYVFDFLSWQASKNVHIEDDSSSDEDDDHVDKAKHRYSACPVSVYLRWSI